MNKLKRYAGTCAAIVLVGMLAAGGATAFGAKSDRGSNPPKIKTSQPWLAGVYSFVALAGICIVAFKNPKRTHTA